MIAHYKGNLPFIDTSQMKKVDKISWENYRISRTQMMENAGLNLALLAKEKFLKNEVQGKKIDILAGSGGNGGGAMVAARRLKAWGSIVNLILSSEESKYKDEIAQQLETLKKLNVSIKKYPGNADLIIDGMIGYGMNGQVNDKVTELIHKTGKLNIPVVSLDAPSGLDLTTGKPSDPTIKANATLTLAMPKLGLFKMHASKYIGELFLADIGIPPQVFQKLHINGVAMENVFREGTLVKINKVIVFN